MTRRRTKKTNKKIINPTITINRAGNVRVSIDNTEGISFERARKMVRKSR